MQKCQKSTQLTSQVALNNTTIYLGQLFFNTTLYAPQTLSNINQNNAQYITLQYTCTINVSVLYSVCRTVCCPLHARTRTAHCDNDNDAHVLHYKRCGISSTRVAEMQIEMSRGVDKARGGEGGVGRRVICSATWPHPRAQGMREPNQIKWAAQKECAA